MADRSVRVRLSATDSGFGRTLAAASAKARAFASDLDSVDNRMSGIVQTGLALGPALVPVMAGAAPVAAGLASGLGAVAAGAGAAALAFSGVGDALEAVNDYQVEPTAENLEKMRAALTELGPAGADFVRYLQSLRPEFDGLQSIARQGLLPGVEAGIDQVMSQLPLLQDIVGNVSVALGDMAEAGGEALAGDFWTQFLRFVRDDAASALTGMAEGFGNIAEGFAGLTMSLDPVADDFGGALLRMSEAFSEWGRNVGQTQGFREFVDYLQSVGPQIGDTLGALGNMLVQFGEAAAPVGQGVLLAVEGIANALAAIANIPVVGPALIGAAAGVAALSRAVALWKASGIASLVTGLRGIDSEGKKASATMTAVGRGGAALLGIGIGIGVIENLGRSLDETLPGLNELQNRMRELAGGDVSALGPQFDSLAESIELVANPPWHEKALDLVGLPESSEMRQAEAEINAIDAALADLVTSKSPEAARRMFAAITEGMSPRQVQDFLSILPGYRDAMAGVGADADIAAEGLSAAERAAQRLNAELANLSANLEKRAALRAYRDSIRQFNQGLEEGPKNLRRGTAAWDAQIERLDGIAAASVTAASHLRGLNKIEFMQQARRDFIESAKRMDMTGQQARRLADNLGLVNQRGKINIHMRAQGLDKTTQDLRRTKEAADNIPDRIDARVKGDTGDAERDLERTADKLKDLDRETAAPRAELRDNASQRINMVDALMGDLGRSDANPAANLRDNASGPISRVGGLLSALDGRTATTTVINRTINIVEGRNNTPIRLPSAHGNIFGSFAYGGDVPNQHQPELAGPGPTRIWREPETKGESYIPHADDHRRPRAIDIWKRTGEILGVNFVTLNALGGLYPVQSFQGGGFVGDARPITAGYVQGRLDRVEPLPSLRAYNEALRERARALARVRRERRQLTRENRDAREAAKALEDAERALDKAKGKRAEQEARQELRRARQRDREARKDAEAAEKQLEAAKDRHAKAQDRVNDAIAAYADKQRDAIQAAEQVSQQIMGTGSIFGGGFVDATSVSARLQRAIRNAEQFRRILGQLSRRGASPWILNELIAEGPSPGALHFARDLLSDPAALGAINAQASRLQQVSERIGAMTSAPAFLQPWGEDRLRREARDAGVYAPVTVHAPQNMDPHQVGEATAQRIVAKVGRS